MNEQFESIDISIIKGLIGDDEVMIRTFFTKFIDTVPANINEIEIAISDQNYTESKAKAHKMKSSAKAIGAIKLADICQAIENQSLECNTESLTQLFGELLNEFENCRKFISEH